MSHVYVMFAAAGVIAVVRRIIHVGDSQVDTKPTLVFFQGRNHPLLSIMK
jgi:hypothetical protein